MLVVTLVLAAIGFGLLVVALMTGSVAWAWGCIAVCVVGAVLLLVSALGARGTATSDGVPGQDRPARRMTRRRPPGDRDFPGHRDTPDHREQPES